MKIELFLIANLTIKKIKYLPAALYSVLIFCPENQYINFFWPWLTLINLMRHELNCERSKKICLFTVTCKKRAFTKDFFFILLIFFSQLYNLLEFRYLPIYTMILFKHLDKSHIMDNAHKSSNSFTCTCVHPFLELK